MGATSSAEKGARAALLKQQNAATSNAVVEAYAEDARFIKLSEREGQLILQRDREDADKLQDGIQIAIDKGVVPKDHVPEPYTTLDVLGKGPDTVADEIIRSCGGASNGLVIVLCGLSGTGKGTTVATLAKKLENVTTWSNGNIFRSVTLLAATWCEQNGYTDFNAEAALTPELLASFMSMLSFGKYRDKFDIKISGLGLDYLVSEVCNTALKGPKVSKNIPTVAKVTQGEVINFAADAIAQMGAAGQTVLLEGREQTVNYVRTPHRFTLTISDSKLLGQRRAAQRMMAAANKELVEHLSDASNELVEATFEKVLAVMVAECE